MVNWNDATLLENEELSSVKLLHLMDGLYIWEFFMTLDYEWQFISGARRAPWTIWIYEACRLTTLVAVVINLVGFNVTHQIDCQTWLYFLLVFSYASFMFASLLITLRSIAIWERKWHVSSLCITIWLTNVGFLIHGITQGKSIWDVTSVACDVLDTDAARDNVLVTTISDIALLGIMLAGLLRKKRATGKFTLWRLLYHQGIAWIVLAAVAEIPPAVFLSLNLNSALNIMFQTPAMIIMTIAATRLYRALSDFVVGVSLSSHPSDPESYSRRESLRNGTKDVIQMRRGRSLSLSDNQRISASQTSRPLEVAVHSTYQVYDGDSGSDRSVSKKQKLGDPELGFGGGGGVGVAIPPLGGRSGSYGGPTVV